MGFESSFRTICLLSQLVKNIGLYIRLDSWVRTLENAVFLCMRTIRFFCMARFFFLAWSWCMADFFGGFFCDTCCMENYMAGFSLCAARSLNYTMRLLISWAWLKAVTCNEVFLPGRESKGCWPSLRMRKAGVKLGKSTSIPQNDIYCYTTLIHPELHLILHRREYELKESKWPKSMT